MIRLSHNFPVSVSETSYVPPPEMPQLNVARFLFKDTASTAEIFAPAGDICSARVAGRVVCPPHY